MSVKQVWRSSDGELFDSEREARNHDAEVVSGWVDELIASTPALAAWVQELERREKPDDDEPTREAHAERRETLFAELAEIASWMRGPGAGVVPDPTLDPAPAPPPCPVPDGYRSLEVKVLADLDEAVRDEDGTTTLRVLSYDDWSTTLGTMRGTVISHVEVDHDRLEPGGISEVLLSIPLPPVCGEATVALRASADDGLPPDGHPGLWVKAGEGAVFVTGVAHRSARKGSDHHHVVTISSPMRRQPPVDQLREADPPPDQAPGVPQVEVRIPGGNHPETKVSSSGL